MSEPYFDDELFRFQTYLSGLYDIGYHEPGYRTNVQDTAPVWDDYRGEGVMVGVNGTIDRRHPDLLENHDNRYLRVFDPLDALDETSGYGTFAAGVVAADDDGEGLVGMAPDASIFSWTGHSREDPDVIVSLGQAEPYGDAADAGALFDAEGRDGLGTVTVLGSPEVGTSVWRTASESLGRGDSVGGMTNSEFAYHSDRGVITTVGAGIDGLPAVPPVAHQIPNAFLPPQGPVLGAMLLVTAPIGTSSYVARPPIPIPLDDPIFEPPSSSLAGSSEPASHESVATTLGLDHRNEDGAQDDGSLGGIWSQLVKARLDDEVGSFDTADYAVDDKGRAASAVVGGAAALMLEANPDLGWRDVQAILAYSADPTKVGKIPFLDEPDWPVSWSTDVQTWNGAGLMHGPAYGFGGLDTRAAVRLAETWGDEARTSANELTVTAAPVPGSNLFLGPLNSSFDDGADDAATIRFRLPEDIEIEHVALDVAFTASGSARTYEYADDVSLQLVSPNGTVSHLSGIVRNDPAYNNEAFAGSAVDHVFTSRAFWGQEGEAGDVWTLRVAANGGDALTVNVSDVALNFHGAPADEDHAYVYTDALVNMLKTPATGDREGNLADNTGHGGKIRDGRGTDTLNASAITADAKLSAGPGGEGVVAGETIYRLASDTAMDIVRAGDGDDRLKGWEAADRLFGGRGDDRLSGKDGDDRLKGEDGQDDLKGGGGRDRLDGGSGKDRLSGGADRDRLDGGAGADRLDGGGGADRLDGGKGGDRLEGGGGADVFVLTRDDARDVVLDFLPGTDRVDASKVADGLRDLRITQRDDDALVRTGDSSLLLRDVDADRLDADDFLF